MDSTPPSDMPAQAPDPAAVARRRFGPLAITATALAGILLVYLLLSWLAFEPLLRWALPRFAAQHAGHQLTFTEARFDPWRLAAHVSGLDLRDAASQPLLAIGQIDVDFDASSPFKRAYVFERVVLDQPVVHLKLGTDGRLNWQALLDSLAGPPAPEPSPDAQPTRWWLRQLAVQQGQLALSDQSHGRDVSARIDPIDLDVGDLSTLPDGQGDLRLAAKLLDGTALRWTGKLALNPLAASGELALQDLPVEALWPYLQPLLATKPLKAMASVDLAYRLSSDTSPPSLRLDQVQVRLQGLALQGADAPAPAVTIDAVSLTGGQLDLARRQLSIDAVEIGPGRIAVERDAAGRVDLQAWLRPAPATGSPAPVVAAAPAASAPESAASSPQGPAASADGPWRVAVKQVRAKALSISLTDQGFASPLTAQVDALQFGFAFQAEAGADATALTVDQLAVGLDSIRLSSAGVTDPWFELASLTLADGRLSTAERQIGLGNITLRGGRLQAERDAEGRVALLQALSPAAAASAPTAAPPSTESGWRYRVERVQAEDFGLTLREGSVTPVVELVVQDLQADAEGLSQDMTRAVPVNLALALKSGGRLSVQGTVVPSPPSADLQLSLEQLSLLPAQPYVAQASVLVLVDGSASSQGRLRWQPQAWTYQGALALDALQVDEADTGDRLLNWKRLSSADLSITQDGLRIGELRADGLGAKLVIFKDKTLNVAKVMKPSPTPAAAPAPASGRPFGVDIDRVQLVDGTLDFADLSLALPFGTRIRDLKGQLVGLSRSGTAPAQLELAGQVDAYGLARASGQLQLFDPTAFSDVKVTFRNVEMTTLTPYSATFAGRKIESGKLSLNLEYKIEKRRLAGENQVVMDQLTLGERVESPTAANLPLDLAIAILQDADGRIDLGLPVSGNLDDPQFSYGQIVWKAIVNVLTKIVTAPFKALGALLGGGEQSLDQVDFDVGRSELLAPEREKLGKLSQVLAKRPALAVTVQGGYDPAGDGTALRQLALRRAVAASSGRTLADGEDPGPISAAQPATRQALAQLYTQRFGAPALASLQQAQQEAQGASSAPPGAEAAASPASAAGSATEAKEAALYDELIQRLLAAESVDDATLRALGEARAQAVRGELLAQGVAEARLVAKPAEARPAKDGAVASVLGVEPAAAAKPAARAASAAR